MISIKIAGLRETNGFIRGLDTNLRKEINKESEQFMKDVRKSAKLRAPRDTGETAESIKLLHPNKRTWTLLVGKESGVYQEEGFTPHWIHSSMIKSSKKININGFIFVSKSKPFITPALEHNLSKLSQRLSNATNRAINKHGGNK